MPTLHLSFKKNPGGGILLHGFLAPNDTAAEKMQEGHAGVCPSYGPEFKAGKTIEEVIEVEEIPTFDSAAIADWVADMFGLDEDEDDEEDDEPEEDDEEEHV